MISSATPTLLILSTALFCQLANAEPASVFIIQRAQQYDGESKFPGSVTDPPGLEVETRIIPRKQSEPVFQSIPTVLEPSYQSYGINGTDNKALGDEIILGGSNRSLESIEVTMVNWARAGDWPVLAGEDPRGYRHPLTVIIYGVQGETLTLLAQKKKETFIPWRPAALDDGGEYPFGGIAFKVRFQFEDQLTLPGKIAVIVAYNTESAGFEPIGEPGPYNSLNVGLAGDVPLIGSDADNTKMLRYLTGVSRSVGFGSMAPMITVRAFSPDPSQGTPRDAGGYLVNATVTEEGFEGEAVANFEITPLQAGVSLSGLRQVAEGTPKSVSVATDPPALPASVVYARRSGPPTARGLYPVFATLNSGNYHGSASAMMRLGYSYETWIAEKVSAGTVSPALAGKSHDPDRDGRTNFEEYLSASDPGLATDGAPSLLEITQDPRGLKLAFLRNHEAIEAEYRLQTNLVLGDPEAWVDLPSEGASPFEPSERMEVIWPLVPNERSRFFRLRSFDLED